MSDILDGPEAWFARPNFHTARRGGTESFEQAQRRKHIDKGLELDAAARLDALALACAQESDVARTHFRSDDYVTLRDLQSFLETMAARIRAERE